MAVRHNRTGVAAADDDDVLASAAIKFPFLVAIEDGFVLAVRKSIAK
jgi:hypothetical protein